MKKVESLEDTIKKNEESFAAKIIALEKKVGDVEVNTLWKIRDCENLLKTRVNEKFVWDALASLENKMKSELDALAASKIKNQESRFEYLQREIKKVEEEATAKINEAKKWGGEIEKL